jgi:hypothetical protein
MKILRATASSDFSARPGCKIVYHPRHGGECLRMGKEHWIPVVTWVRLHEPSGEPAGNGSAGNGELEEADGPGVFEELDSSEKVVWINKRRR